MENESRAGDFYFRTKEFEGNGSIYKKVGVKRFEKLYMATMGRYTDAALPDTSLSTLRQFEAATRRVEAVHVGFLSMMAGLSVVELSNNEIGLLLVNLGVNTIVNAFPIMLQRYHRGRIERILERAENSESTECE